MLTNIFLVIPAEIWGMFTGSELECLVCGPRDFSIASLKRNIRSIVDPQLIDWLFQVSFISFFISFHFSYFLFVDSRSGDSKVPRGFLTICVRSATRPIGRLASENHSGGICDVFDILFSFLFSFQEFFL